MRRTWSREIFELLELPVTPEPPPMDAVLQIYTPAQRAQIYAAIGTAITAHQSWHHVLRMVTATGRIFTATSIGHPVFDASGRVTHYEGCFHELLALERKLAV